jgi:hypothetical protein
LHPTEGPFVVEVDDIDGSMILCNASGVKVAVIPTSIVAEMEDIPSGFDDIDGVSPDDNMDLSIEADPSSKVPPAQDGDATTAEFQRPPLQRSFSLNIVNFLRPS